MLFLFSAKAIPPIRDCNLCKFRTSKVPIFTLNKYQCQKPYLRGYCGSSGKTPKPYKTTKTVVITDNFMYVPPPGPYFAQAAN